MGFQSQSGFVGIKTQSSKGSYTDPGAVAPNQGVYLRTRSGAMGGNRTLMVPDPEIGGNRDVPDAELGPVAFAGQYNFYGRMESLATLLYGALGAKGDAGSVSTGYTHTINSGATLPWMSVEENIAGTFDTFRYTDAKVNTLHLEAAADGYLLGTVGMVALTQVAGATPTAPTARRVDTSPLLVGTNITVNYKSVALPAKSFSFDINNNLEENDFRLGSLFLGDLVEKRRELTAGVTIRPSDNTLWRQAMYGSPTSTSPLGLSYKAGVTIHIVTYEDIPGATAGVKYDALFTFPQAIIEPWTLNPNGDDVIQNDLVIRMVRPDPTVDIVTATVKNSYATVA